MKRFIDINAEARKVARNDFEKDFYKLMSNSVFGKTMENKRDRANIEIVNGLSKGRRLRRLVSQTQFIHVQYRRFDSNGKALFLIVRTVQIDSSYSIGIRTIQIDQMDTIFFHSTHACQMVKWYHAVYNTVCRSQSNG